MATFNVHAAKTHFSQLLERVAQGEEVVIAKGPSWLMRISCDSLFTGRSVEPKPSDWMYFCASVTQ